MLKCRGSTFFYFKHSHNVHFAWNVNTWLFFRINQTLPCSHQVQGTRKQRYAHNNSCLHGIRFWHFLHKKPCTPRCYNRNTQWLLSLETQVCRIGIYRNLAANRLTVPYILTSSNTIGLRSTQWKCTLQPPQNRGHLALNTTFQHYKRCTLNV